MLWGKDIPVISIIDDTGKETVIELIAGSIDGTDALPPTPDSWAADPQNRVAILTARIESGGKWVIPQTDAGVNRMVYFYKGSGLLVDGMNVSSYKAIQIKSDRDVEIQAADTDCFILMLQAKPINEPVMQYGPFVMNTMQEIQDAFRDYRETEFGGWPWPVRENTHGPGQDRFAKHPEQ
jgi:redox-sensitive bicupin YhaK (pirin superfamily)